MSREVGSPGQEREVYRVLIADDDRQCRSSISLLLKHDGFEPVEVDGGQLLLEVLRRQLFGDFDSEGVRLTAREYRTRAPENRRKTVQRLRA